MQIGPKRDRRRGVVGEAGQRPDKAQQVVPQVFAGSRCGGVGRSGGEQQRIEVGLGPRVSEIAVRGGNERVFRPPVFRSLPERGVQGADGVILECAYKRVSLGIVAVQTARAHP